jgi:hypothetical protein
MPFAFEAETGTVNAPAYVVDDSQASNAKAVQFDNLKTDAKWLIAQSDGYNSCKDIFTDPAVGSCTTSESNLSQNRAFNFSLARPVFNTVMVLPGEQQRVIDARNAGMNVILEFDYKWDWACNGGTYAEREAAIKPKIDALISQVKANPDTIQMIHVADRLNSWANDPDGTGCRQALNVNDMKEYLRITGGRFHNEIPGVKVVADVENHQMTCDKPGQAACANLDSGTSMYRYESNAVLDELYNSTYLDGFVIANNLSNSCSGGISATNCWNPDVQRQAWHDARVRWPKPFFLSPRTSRLSFSAATFDQQYSSLSSSDRILLAERQTQAALNIPLEEGTDGADVWGWHIDWTGSDDPGIRTWINKDFSTNTLWDKMKAISEHWGAAESQAKAQSFAPMTAGTNSLSQMAPSS